ncbi:hypothetical protein MTO96_005146 [Rhipicephalus appendiculatus]
MEEGESESEEFMLALVAHSATDRDVSRPLEKVLAWAGQKLGMIIDSGSPKKENSDDMSTKCDFGKRSKSSKKPP